MREWVLCLGEPKADPLESSHMTSPRPSDVVFSRVANAPAMIEHNSSEEERAGPVSANAMIALLGRLDLPTDGVRDYCELLSGAFARRGKSLEVVQLRWENDGWLKALIRLWRQSGGWKNRIVLLQYTALMWSRRGFPAGALAVLAILKIRRVRLGAVFHDGNYAPASGWIQRIRRACQLFAIRAVFRCAEFPVLTVPASQLFWLPGGSGRAAFIPVGANFPPGALAALRKSSAAKPTVAVFGVTGGAHNVTEAREIAGAMKYAAARVPGLRLDVFGRGALESEPALRTELAGTDILISVAGVLSSQDVRARLAQADVLLFVRGPISSRRGSAIAGIVCGIPVVGYRGAETASPITEAGVLLVESNDRTALAEALTRVLTDGRYYAGLCTRNAEVTAKYLSWDAIAAQFARVVSQEV